MGSDSVLLKGPAGPFHYEDFGAIGWLHEEEEEKPKAKAVVQGKQAYRRS